jgi:hypothetical protein
MLNFMACLEFLKIELAAIDSQDRFYWQTEKPERHQRLGYFLRQERRRILMAELLKVMQGLQLPGGCRRNPGDARKQDSSLADI